MDKFKKLDFLAAVGASTYAVLVSSVPELSHLAEVFATPQVAVAFAGAAILRWYMDVRKEPK